MEQLRKAFVMVSAAIMASQLGTKASCASTTADDGDNNDAQRLGESGSKQEKKKPAKRAKDDKKRRPPEWEPDLNMPAGTAYDVIDRDDVG